MSDYVVDASVAVEYLLKTPVGLAMADTLDSDLLAAPELIDAEVLSVLRRQVLGGRLEEARARLAISALLLWPIERISHRSLAPLAWEHYQNISAFDAFYVAAARAPGPPPADCRRASLPGIRLGNRRAACADGVISTLLR